jgi:3-oxoacyl-[acyl-carrier-protein] synthase-3
MTQTLRGAGIIGLGSAVPRKVVTNYDLESLVDTTHEWIVERTGITERRIAEDDIAASDLGLEAARKALESAGLAPADIDLIIVATFTADHPLPSTSCIIQDKLGATNAAAFDLAAGCSGFVYGIATATSFIRSGIYKNVLVVGVDLLSRVTDWSDRTTCVLFGDGAGAAVVAPVDDGDEILDFVLGSDGAGKDALKIDAGGSRSPITKQKIEERQHFISMSGREVFRFAVKIMGDASVKVLEKAGLTPDDVDLFVPHQANIRIIDSAARRLKLPAEKVFVNVQKYGNTSAASVPLALTEAHSQGLMKKGDVIVMVGFGAGLTWAAGVMKWWMGPSDGRS